RAGGERNPFFRYINRNKKSVTLDYKGPTGRAVFLRLVRSVDVLVEKYPAPGVGRAGPGAPGARRGDPPPRLRAAERLRARWSLPGQGRARSDRSGHGRAHARHRRGWRAA